jgi:hypothetical protein
MISLSKTAKAQPRVMRTRLLWVNLGVQGPDYQWPCRRHLLNISDFKIIQNNNERFFKYPALPSDRGWQIDHGGFYLCRD